MKTYTVQCERDESGTWVATVPELPGVVTQARRLANIPDLARDAIELWLDDESVQVDLNLEVVGAEAARATWAESRRLRADAEEKATESAKLAREAVADLDRLGLSMRDAALVLDVSFQRVNQLKPKRQETPAKAAKKPHRTATSKSRKGAAAAGKVVANRRTGKVGKGAVATARANAKR